MTLADLSPGTRVNYVQMFLFGNLVEDWYEEAEDGEFIVVNEAASYDYLPERSAGRGARKIRWLYHIERNTICAGAADLEVL